MAEVGDAQMRDAPGLRDLQKQDEDTKREEPRMRESLSL